VTSDRSLARPVSRLENDTEAIYEILTTLTTTQVEHTRRFDAVDRRLAAHDGRFDRIDATLAEVVRRLPEP
jgi:hypothetical protein